MNASAKRAFSALATVSVLTVTLFGIVGLTATKASAATCNWISAPTTGNVGDTLQFKVRITDAASNDLSSWFLYGSNFARSLNSQTLTAPGVGGQPGYLESTASYTFTSAGSYRVTGPLTECGSISVTIAAAPTPTPAPTAAPATPTPSNGGGGGGGQTPAVSSATPTATASETPLESVAGAVRSPRGALFWVLAIAAIILLAIIAGALLRRRRD
jgi:hypothetical protein